LFNSEMYKCTMISVWVTMGFALTVFSTSIFGRTDSFSVTDS
jgi:hypothetical protein